MNPLPPPAPPPAPEPVLPAAAPVPASPAIGWAVWLAWAVAGLALLVTALLWQRLGGMQEQLARQSQESGRHALEARTLARNAETEVRESVGRLAALDGRVNDLVSYRNQLDALVQAVVRGHDENLVVELETTLRLAQDQAQLTGRIEPLLAALRSAERRLGRTTDMRFDGVAQAVARDLSRIQRVPAPDTGGLLARIEQLLHQVDSLPLANAVAVMGRAARPVEVDPDAAANGWWQRWKQALSGETQRLLRVSRIDHPDAAMLSPEQSFFVRENLRLRLQGARLAVLARQHDAAQGDLAVAAALLEQWFDPGSRRSQAASNLLRRVRAEIQAVDLPRVDESLLALEQAAALGGLR